MSVLAMDNDDIMITIHTNKDVDQIIVNSGAGEFLLTPITTYSDEQLKGNNQIMDMNGDHQVDDKDLEILQTHLDGGCKDYTATARCSHCGATDINMDDKIDDKDLKLLKAHLDGKCKLDDCYFHGIRENRTETADGYIWSFHYTPTIRGMDDMTYTPQSITTTGTRSGEVMALSVHAEEYKNPVILKKSTQPNQNKYLIGSSITLSAVTPLETDQVVFKTNKETLIATSPDSTDYVKKEKTWKQSFVADTAGNENITIIGQGEQSNNTYLPSEVPANYIEKIVDPRVLSTGSSSTRHENRWTTSATDVDGKVTITEHVDVWYTITATATANADTDYVVFNTPNGNVTDNSSYNSGGNKCFSTSWTSGGSGGSAGATAYCNIISK
ncbi:hypothetical protein [Acetobacterium bakii]|nr:hypothetical protein [Acetobacterium bakii]